MQRGSVDGIRKGFTGKGSDELLTAPSSPIRQSIIVHKVDVANNSGSDAACGYGYKILDANWKAGQWDDSATPKITDDTTDAQDAGADDFALTTTTSNDGHVVSAAEPFELVGYTVSTASVGSPVYEYAYWNGSAWTAFEVIVAPDFSATGETALAFSAPSDWAKGGSGTDELDDDQYHIRVRATTAPSTAPLATQLWVVRLLDLVGTVSDGTTVNEIRYVVSSGAKIPPGHALVPYCSVSDAGNTISVEYSHL